MILFALVMSFGLAFGTRAQTESVLITDFDKGEKTTILGEDFNIWEGFPNDLTQGCKLKFANDDALGKENGKSIRLDYDVDSPNPAYNGFWLKLSKAPVANFTTLSFYVKGDAAQGFTPKIKIELKDKNRGKANFFVENITDKWQKISLTIDPRSFSENQLKPFEEFVIVFDDVNSRPKSGRILIDYLVFSRD